MIGAPGSGKSTYLKKHNIPNSVIVSRDKIRYEFLKDGDLYFSKEKQVYKKFVEEIAAALAREDIDFVFADQTSLNEAARAKLLNALSGRRAKYDKLNAIVFHPPLKQVLMQNLQRSGREYVPERAVVEMYNKLTFPTKEEGFDNVYFFSRKNWWHYGK